MAPWVVRPSHPFALTGQRATYRRERFLELTGEDPRSEPAREWDYAADDVVLPHPVHRRQAWVAVVNPGERTTALAIDLLRDAHEQARRRSDRERSR